MLRLNEKVHRHVRYGVPLSFDDIDPMIEGFNASLLRTCCSCSKGIWNRPLNVDYPDYPRWVGNRHSHGLDVPVGFGAERIVRIYRQYDWQLSTDSSVRSRAVTSAISELLEAAEALHFLIERCSGFGQPAPSEPADPNAVRTAMGRFERAWKNRKLPRLGWTINRTEVRHTNVVQISNKKKI
jgi:hypothetical protein